MVLVSYVVFNMTYHVNFVFNMDPPSLALWGLDIAYIFPSTVILLSIHVLY